MKNVLSGGYFVFGLLRDKTEFEELSGKLKKNMTLILADISSNDSISKIQAIVKD